MAQLLRSISELRQWREKIAADTTIGFVPTMGALHSGHLSLVEESGKRADLTVVSIFVNPTQFAPGEDLEKYPRTLEADLSLLEKAGVDVVFTPSADEIFPFDSSTWIHEDQVSKPLCGAFRPGHFQGVATVVLKLFNLVQPSLAFFGQKDAQQCALIQRVVRDLNVPVEIQICPTVRESDGLAMSSRNRYLAPEARKKAARIYQSLKLAEEHFLAGEKRAEVLRELGKNFLESEPAFEVQYWEIIHPDTLVALDDIGDDGALIAVAAYMGETRLIDNWVLRPKGWC